MGPAATKQRTGFRSGTRLGRFSLGPLLARGGMGELYLARSDGVQRFSKLLAVKVLLPQLTDDPDFVQMFLHEARITARLDHPNIAAVTELGETSDDYFIAIEYVHGRDLRAILREEPSPGALPLDCALQIVSQVCAGLHYAHTFVDSSGARLDVVHRDVTPSNVVVRYDGGVKIIDFGIAKTSTGTRLTRTGTMKGKPGYMSPEQCLEGAVDARTDIWGLGVLLYETTLGRKLFVGDNDFAIMGRVIRGEFAAPSEVLDGYPPALEAILRRALAVDPRDRFASAQEFADAIHGFATDRGLRLSPTCVADHMRSLFGAPPVPEVDTVVAPRAVASRPLIWAVVVTAAVAMGAFALGSRDQAASQEVPPKTLPAADASVGALQSSVPPEPEPESGVPVLTTVPPNPSPSAPPNQPTAPDPQSAPVRPDTRGSAVPTSKPAAADERRPERRPRPTPRRPRKRKTERSKPARDLDALIPVDRGGS